MIDLSIVIVSYNARKFLLSCLLSIEKSVGNLKHEVIVVDNDSSDRSGEMVKNEFPSAVLIESKRNLGFSKANNLGVKKAKGKYILFLNPDTLLQDDVLDKMVKFMDNHKSVGVSTCRLVMPNGKLDDACHRGFPTPWNAFCYFSGLAKIFSHSRIFSGYNLGFLDLSKTHEIDACAGAFMLVRREAGEEISWWDEDYFFYGEDLEFCYRLKEKGWKTYFVPSVSILHHKGVSGGIKKISKEVSTADKKTKKMATLARFQAMKIFYNKHYRDKYPRFITWLVMQGVNLKLWTALRLN
ncbi:MAG: glycosyltransferase family 2 protein [Patescibacteria group bacterium]|nr:glycosyltransferase family 2 protein [Patescibacteria group bacterium]MCL6096507.1 glycosyltransferase family 2 protein [Patescibacteria group bacterium]